MKLTKWLYEHGYINASNFIALIRMCFTKSEKSKKIIFEHFEWKQPCTTKN